VGCGSYRKGVAKGKVSAFALKVTASVRDPLISKDTGTLAVRACGETSSREERGGEMQVTSPVVEFFEQGPRVPPTIQDDRVDELSPKANLMEDSSEEEISTDVPPDGGPDEGEKTWVAKSPLSPRYGILVTERVS